MNLQSLIKSGNGRFAIAVMGALLGSGVVASASSTKPSAPPKAAPAPHASAPASHPAAGGASHTSTSTAGHATTTTGAHTTTTTGSHPATTTAGHTTTTTAGHTTTTTAGHGTTTTAGHTAGTTGAAHTGATGGAHTAATGGASHAPAAAGRAPAGTTASHSSISKPVPKGVTEKTTKDGSAIRTRPGGKVSDVHDAKRGMDIHHGLDGSRRVSVERHDGSRLVAERGRPGYVQRGYSYHGRDYGHRAYYYHGGYYHNYYHGYGWRGGYYNVYAPGYYYGVGYYGWAYNPWARPFAYGWGWGGSPWFGFYGGFFNPYPVYPSAAFWLTDYVISANLQAAYAARQAAASEAAQEAAAAGQPAPAGGVVALTPEVKQQIADEVKAQIALENQEAAQTAQHQDVDPGSSGIARMLADGHPHAFVAGGSLDVTDSTGAECALSDGDALVLTTPPAADASTANLTVLASKGGVECAKGATVAVALTDLQEMQNHLRESIDKGLADLKAKQGTGGIPAAPPSAQAAGTEPGYVAVAPPPAPTDAADIQAQTADADKAETEVSAAAQNNAAHLEPAPLIPGTSPAAPDQELGQAMVEEFTVALPKRRVG
jgi:hypothetical protein